MNSENSNSVSFKAVWRVGGAIIAFLIGSGFASGEEIFQFFTVYGVKGILGATFCAVVFCLVSGILVKWGYNFLKDRDENDKSVNPYHYYLGKFFGTFMQWYTPFFAFLINIVMISGAGATMEQYFGIDASIGSLIMTVIVTLTALLGLRKLIDIISLLGPLTILFTMIIAVWTLFENPGGIANADAVIAQADNLPFGAGGDTSYWFLAAILFAGYQIVAGVPFMTNLGREVSNAKEAILGGLVGGIGLMGAAFLLNLAMLGDIETMNEAQIPVLYLAEQLSPLLGFLFAFILLEEIFSTSAPMLWTVVDSVVKQDSSQRTRRIAVLAISVLTLIVAQLPFNTLVNTIYPFTGYFGIAMIILFIGREVYDYYKVRKGVTV